MNKIGVDLRLCVGKTFILLCHIWGAVGEASSRLLPEDPIECIKRHAYQMSIREQPHIQPSNINT
jgi:hypothetical protein